jgi:murein L,D-transpeptidase YafK
MSINVKRVILLFMFFGIFVSAKNDFKNQQIKYPKVRQAIKEKENLIKELFKSKKIEYPAKVFIRVFKLEAKLELWALKDNKYELVKRYPICASSGEIGPKRQQGDYQVPEGFYHINHFNPYSSYYLSLGVSYPNKLDKIHKTKNDAGGAIYIHGDCVTIGCMPLTNDIIKEVYVILVDSRNSKQTNIPVSIFPCDMDKDSCKKEMKKYPKNEKFWENIKEGYDYFEKNRTLPKVIIDKKGKYIFK